MHHDPDGDLVEQVVESRPVFQGRIISVQVDRVRLADGQEAEREVVHHPGAVAILPVLEDGRVALVRQYRHAPGQVLVEVPAGKLDPGESPQEAAVRELAEETGLEAREWRSLGSGFTSPGFCDERIHLFVATGCRRGTAHPDSDERLKLVLVHPEELTRWVAEGRVEDLKSLALLAAVRP